MIIDGAIYRAGNRLDRDVRLGEIPTAATAGPETLVWIDVDQPSVDELSSIAEAFDLPELAVEDALHAHQRAKLERYGPVSFLVLRPADYVDDREAVEFGEVHVFAGAEFVVTVRHGTRPDLAAVRRELESRPEILQRGPLAVMHAILDRVVDDYAPVAAGIENDIYEIEDQLFSQDADPSRRTYELIREVIAFQRATSSLAPMIETLMEHDTAGEHEQRYLRDVHDHVLRLQDQVEGFRELLNNVLHVNLTMETKALTELSNRQGEEVKRISAWAAILFAPTVVGTVYGMNFRHMPELHWQLGYPMALGLMVVISVLLYLVFRRRNWI